MAAGTTKIDASRRIQKFGNRSLQDPTDTNRNRNQTARSKWYVSQLLARAFTVLNRNVFGRINSWAVCTSVHTFRSDLQLVEGVNKMLRLKLISSPPARSFSF